VADTVSWNPENGELVISGRRHMAIDIQALCRHVDLLVGPRVAAVIFNQHWFRLGREDAARIKVKKSTSDYSEIVDELVQHDRLLGSGVTKLTMPPNPNSPIELEISNPCLESSEGAGKAILTSYWCGVFTFLLGREVIASKLTFDHKVARCRLEVKLPQHILEAR
jgi:hypothetical protein